MCSILSPARIVFFFFFFQAEDGIRDLIVTGVQTCALPISPWVVRRPQLQAREHFDLGGRVAVATAHEGFNANLHWEQQGVRSQLTLAGPLGTGAVQISASGNDLDIVTARGEHLDSSAAHADLATRLG